MHDDELQQTNAADQKARRRQTARLVFIGIVGAVFAAVALDNRQEVDVGWVIGEASLPLVVAMVASLLAGLAIGTLLGRRSGD